MRVSPAELRNYAGISEKDSTDVSIFLEMATGLVDDELLSQGLSTTRLKAIELNLAAHYAILSIERGGFKMQKAGESMESYQDQKGTNLGSTRFGQQAMSLDPSGKLSSLASPKGKAEFRVM